MFFFYFLKRKSETRKNLEKDGLPDEEIEKQLEQMTRDGVFSKTKQKQTRTKKHNSMSDMIIDAEEVDNYQHGGSSLRCILKNEVMKISRVRLVIDNNTLYDPRLFRVKCKVRELIIAEILG